MINLYTRTKKIGIRFALFLICACSVQFSVLRAEKIDFEIMYDWVLDAHDIALSFEPNAKKIYPSSFYGLSISEIECDEEKLKIEDSGICIYIDVLHKEVSKAAYYTYICPASGSLYFACSVDEKTGDYKAKVVEIPKRWGYLLIKYRARYVDGTMSREYIARFSRILPKEAKEALGIEKR